MISCKIFRNNRVFLFNILPFVLLTYIHTYIPIIHISYSVKFCFKYVICKKLIQKITYSVLDVPFPLIFCFWRFIIWYQFPLLLQCKLLAMISLPLHLKILFCLLFWRIVFLNTEFFFLQQFKYIIPFSSDLCFWQEVGHSLSKRLTD